MPRNDQLLTSQIAARRATCGLLKSGARCRSGEPRSGEVVEDLLHVVVLLDAVDEVEDLLGVVLGQLDGRLRHVLRLGRDGRDAALLERLLQLAEVGESAP